MAYVNSVFYITSLLVLARCVQCDCDNEGFLTVLISFASLNPCSLQFFQQKFTPEIIEQFKECPTVHFNVMPCATSSIVMEELTCWGDDKECKMEKLQTCAKMKLGDEENGIAYAKVASCMMNGGDPAKCGGKIWDSMNNCQSTKEAMKTCESYWNTANNDMQLTNTISVAYEGKFDVKTSTDATEDFIGTTCAQLKKKQLQCQICN